MSKISDHFTNLNETQKRGQATEALLKAQFSVRDIPVLSPDYDNESYDFVVEICEEFCKIQAKTAYEGPTVDTAMFETVSTRIRSSGYERAGYQGKIDFFAVYFPPRREYYLIPIEDAAEGKMEIRFVEPKNNQQTGINWYEDYLLDSVLSDLRTT